MVEREDPACRLRSHELLHDQKNKSAAIDHFFSHLEQEICRIVGPVWQLVFSRFRWSQIQRVMYSTYIDYYCRVGSS